VKAATFVDTSYFLALVNNRDQYHHLAQEASQKIQPPFMTSEAVLIEVGNTLSRPPARNLGKRVLQEIFDDPDIEIVTIDHQIFDEAVALYTSRVDKTWGLTDCTSFVIMKRYGLSEALTTDKHFEQAGFRSLLHHL
jgi:predicted nucleic acid-binding protein